MIQPVTRGLPPIKILIVEDEPALQELLEMAVRAEGWESHTVGNGFDALTAHREFAPDAIILDIMIPGPDGMEVAQRIRQHSDTPIMFVTAKADATDRIGGLRAGADDYVTKPFNLEEIVLRLRNLVKRTIGYHGETGTSLVVGDLVLDDETFDVTRAGMPIDLTSTEFALLHYLMENPRRVLSKSQILTRVWEDDIDSSTHAVEICVSYLRKKIDRYGPPMIRTHRGLGYSIRASDD